MPGKDGGFTADERAAMKSRAAELRAEAKAAKSAARAEIALRAVLDAIAAMPEHDRMLAEGFHRIVTDVAPQLAPKTWYGFPAYTRDGKVVCFFQHAAKFGTRYATVGFQDDAHLDDGQMWPTTFAVTALTPEVEARLRELVARAAG